MLNWQLQLFPQRNEAQFIVYIATDLFLTFEVDRDANISEYQNFVCMFLLCHVRVFQWIYTL